MKRQLLQQELQSQGKKPKLQFWGRLSLILVLMFATGLYWYQATLESRLEKTFQKGLQLKQTGQYVKALELFSDLQKNHPSFVRAPKALFQVAEIQESYLSRYSEALLSYLLLERDYPEAPEVPIAQQRVAFLFKYRLDDCGQAIAAYQKVIDQPGSENDRSQYEVADCYFRLNNFEQARIEFENLLNNYPSSELADEVQYRIAVTYALEGKLPEASAAYRVVMENWPQSSYAMEASFGLAKVLEEQEELLEALKILEELAGIYPKQDILKKKTEQVRDRINKKKKAI